MIKEQCNIQCFIMHSILEPRKKQILKTSNQVDQNYLRSIKGHRSDTKELNINIKTLTLAHLRQLSSANELSAQQSQIVANFARMPACFQSITYLFFGGDGAFKGEKLKQISQEEFMLNQSKQNSIPYMEARQKIRNQCKALYRSTYFIKSFFKSSRMHFKNKLIILKYLKKIENLPFRRFKQKQFQWKNLDFQN